ncbi:YceI family protein [Vibrio sagamiensis]|uniref:Lipid/polyisoprenoid-binding YceI-like domain-containing protein n=1 Tax=Vibrio sagamiensis NBRC 104589 TaxID=1219064 RepID=A0A511QCJ1_9VIBR|nr:YceI family protein [Vibrio sagamiensis]PNQ54088.1 YceI family protein [Vibrio agarivorans]GEM75010.1 hypothetical protein VSA01S_11220 [Vibrio sagamiensis NBRC 104589]
MKSIIKSISLAFMTLSGQVFSATEYELESEFSSISFATIKKQYIVEPATLNTLKGSINNNGKFELTIGIKGIDTGVTIRNTRLQEIFFSIEKFPNVTVTGSIALAELPDGSHKMIIPANVTLFGSTKTLNFPIVMFKAAGTIMISSIHPIIINANDFGIPNENLAKLSSTVGNIAISDTVPLSLVLTFKK